MRQCEDMWEFPDVGSLNQPDPREFEFLPRVGFRYIGDGRSIVLAATSISKPGVFLADEDLFKFGRRIQDYFDGTGGFGEHAYEPHRVFADGDFRTFDEKYVYKFMSEDTYEKYLRKGSILLSSLRRFREFEEQGDPAGDRFEGRSFCAYAVGGRELLAATLSGFDTFIFSSTRDLREAEEMSRKFGSVILRINLIPFARELSRQIGQVHAEIRLVRYSDLKLHRSSLPIRSVAGFPPNLTAALARALRHRGRLPALFGKPRRFASEREVRISFQMPKDVADRRSVTADRLLKYVKRIN